MLGREGADGRTLGRIYVEVVQDVLLYGSETWVMTLRIGRLLVGFHHRVYRKMTRHKPRIGRYGEWMYPPPEEAMVEAGLHEVETYVSHHQSTFTQFIATRPIMDLCLAAERRTGSWVAKRWWQQDGLDLEGMRMTDQEVERADGGGGDRWDSERYGLTMWEDAVSKLI